ncbi:Lin0512 family protein [Marivita sp. XM-24bin2]|jgi:uncharacterized protein (TIGR02058 family)|uniref:Lin0512 family protein n=1 Tax=unclassified Marivita TaxID=2632480 RepID=UPI000D7AC136|nr:Lin0512 family protein [Marivita sp. XM-24bin2]MCR9108493.1 Lin0512 family protein [Paracoccaceae bacterium]PWL34725.1 MAG: hypothetical protein DCO97_12935 [Marivita sp. XM-24bin2]
MSDHRFIIEMGMGNDQYGMDYTKAAARAIEDAIRHSSIPLFDATGLPHDQMRVQVTVGVAEPDKVDCAELAKGLPRGRATVTAVEGGLNVTNPDSGATLVIATAAVEAFLRRQG